MSDELIREVNEAMQKERMQAFWDRYGKQLLGAAGVAVLLAIASLVYQQQQTAGNQQRTSLLLEAREQFAAKQYEQARQSFAKVSDESKGETRALALIWQAKAASELKDNAGALEAYAQASEAKAGEKSGVFAAFACLSGAMLAPQDARFAACLPKDASAPLFAMAAEMRAVDAALDPKADTVVLPNPQSLPFSQRQRVDDLNIYLSSKSDAE